MVSVSGELFRQNWNHIYNWFIQHWHVVTAYRKKKDVLLLLTNIYSLILIASDQLNLLHIVMHLLIVILLLISELISCFYLSRFALPHLRRCILKTTLIVMLKVCRSGLPKRPLTSWVNPTTMRIICRCHTQFVKAYAYIYATSA